MLTDTLVSLVTQLSLSFSMPECTLIERLVRVLKQPKPAVPNSISHLFIVLNCVAYIFYSLIAYLDQKINQNSKLFITAKVSNISSSLNINNRFSRVNILANHRRK